jgi:sugar phosphate isomerase/epimerase
MLGSRAAAEQGTKASPFRTDNLVAWCVVPFDAQKRGPAERAAMLQRLGFTKLAYDWRAEHVPQFEEEIVQLKQHGIEYFAFWSQHEEAFRLFEKHGLRPQIWQTAPSPKEGTQAEKIAAAARQLLPLVERTRQLGCRLGLYNHGGWGGEPDNLVAVCEHLRRHHDAPHVGIVYNLHHGHDHLEGIESALKRLQPYLLCLNLNGMNDHAQPKILTIGQGRHDRRMIEAVIASGYKGPIGIIDHRPETDAEETLRENLAGLEGLLGKGLPGEQ